MSNPATGLLERSYDKAVFELFEKEVAKAANAATATGRAWKSGDTLFNEDIDGHLVIVEVW